MRRRQALGAIGAILVAAAAPALIPKERLMSLKLIREATAGEIDHFNGGQNAFYARHFHGWSYLYTKDGRDYYKPTHPTLKAHGGLGIAPTPLEMEGLGMDPQFARPVFVPGEKQFLDHSSKETNLLKHGFEAWTEGKV
jgi:hypothetical protein